MPTGTKRNDEHRFPAVPAPEDGADQLAAAGTSEEELRRSRALWAKAEQLSNTGAWEWDLETDIWTFSDQWLAIHGGTRHKMATADLLPIAHPEDRSRIEQALADLRAGTQSCHVELRIIRQDTGEVRMIRSSAEVVRDAAGLPVKAWGAAQDITVWRLAEDELRRTGERQAFIVKLSDAVRPLLDPVELQVTASRLLGEYLEADRAHYAEYFELEGYVVIQPDFIRGEGRSLAGRYKFAEYGEVPAALGAGQTLVVPDTQNFPGLSDQVRETCRSLGIHAFVVTPSMRAGTLVRSLTVAAAQPRAWTAAEVALIQEAADRTWAAVDRACAEAALRASEERLRMALASAGMGMWRWDNKKRQLWVSPEHQRLFGLPETIAEPQTIDYRRVIHPDDLLALDQGFQQVWIRGGQFDVAYRIWRAGDDLPRWIQSTGKRMTTPDGRDYFFGISRDITRRRQAEESLRQSEQRLRLAQQVARVGTFDWDVESGVNTWTSDTEALYGLAAGQFGGTQASWEQLIHPEDRKRMKELARRTLESGEPAESEFRVCWPDGSVHWLISRWQAMQDATGRPVRLAGVNLDITARKTVELALQEREREFRRVLDAASVGLARCDQDKRYVWANHPYCDLVSVPQERIVGLTVEEAMGPGYRVIEPFITRVLNGERIDFETEVPVASGVRHFHVVATPDEGDGGVMRGYFVSVADISERKALEREVLRISETERQRVAIDLHDGICQELVAIGFAAKGVQRQLEKHGNELMESMTKITNAISQAAAHTRQIAHQMNPMVGGGDGLMLALQKLALAIAEKGELLCEFECSQPAPALDPVIGNQLYRIAQEAIANASQHSGGKRIRVALRETDAEIRIEVSDDGCGLTKEVISRPGFGLRAMRYRAGLIHAQLTIRNGDSGGTEVFCAVPKTQTEALA